MLSCIFLAAIAHKQTASHRENRRLLGLRIALSLAAVGALSGGWSFFISSSDSPLPWWVDWLQAVGTEMLGAAVTILLVELAIYQKRDEANRLDRERMRRRNHFAAQLKQAQNSNKRQEILSRMKQQNLLAGAWLYAVDLQPAALPSLPISFRPGGRLSLRVLKR